MTSPDCTEHGTLMLEYVRGHLSDSEGLHAEAVSAECADCQAWLDTQFSGPDFSEVENAVSHSLQTTALPNRNRRFGWMTAAAAILVIAGGLTVMQFPNQSAPTLADQHDQTQSSKIGTFDFEGGSIGNASVALEESSGISEAIDSVEGDLLFSDDLEDGDTGAWIVHT